MKKSWSNRRKSGDAIRAAALATSALLGASICTKSASAADSYWDSDGVATGNLTDGTGLGGPGTWNNVNANWWDGSSGTDQPWNSANNDTAVFIGTAANVTLGGPVTASQVNFKSS